MYLIVTNNEEIANLAKESGAQILKINSENSFTKKSHNQSNYIADNATPILISLGIRPNIKGFKFIKYILETPYEENTPITKVIYPSVARHFSDTPLRVERAIRHAIQKSFEFREHYPEWLNVFGNTTIAPSNNKFIATLRLYLKENT